MRGGATGASTSGKVTRGTRGMQRGPRNHGRSRQIPTFAARAFHSSDRDVVIPCAIPAEYPPNARDFFCPSNSPSA